MEAENNQDLQLAYDFVRFTNRNIFITGKAGTGKTTFLKDLKRLSPKRMIVVAPTGVAAINAGGVTIHSFFQLPFHPYVPAFYIPGADGGNRAESSSPPGYKMSREKVRRFKSLDLLIIDEISMVRADTLDAMDSALRRYKARHLPFGGVQLLMIGDLQQLAPVVKEEDREILDRYYDSFFFFGSKALACTDYVTIELKHIYRQDDQVFIDLLNKVRENKADEAALEQLNKRYIPDFDPESGGGYITLTTHNHQAQTINDSKLEKLPGRVHMFKAIVKDDFPEFSFPNASELTLKAGAQVMFIKNDISSEKLFFNGKIGKIEAFEDDIIIVRCPGDDFPIRVEKAEWQNMKFTINEETKEIEEEVIGTFTQYPLRLAWAITIHKSQGLTFDRAIIDACAAFAHGQVYVALSRCRSLEGLVLSSRIGRRSLVDNPVISEFVNGVQQNQPDRTSLEESRRAYQRQLLAELFDFTSLVNRLNYCKRIFSENPEAFIGDPHGRIARMLSDLNTGVTEVSGKFQPHLDYFLKKEPDAESNQPLQERVQKAALYFSEKLSTGLAEILEGFAIETDNKAIRKSAAEALSRLHEELVVKLACLETVSRGFETAGYLEARAKSAIDIPDVKTRPVTRVEDTSGTIKHPELLGRLKEWRSGKAKEKGQPHFMIMHQKTIVTIANTAPQSLNDLKRVKGMGKKKTEQYGEELLEIILAFYKGGNSEGGPDTEDLAKDEDA